jgi:hypothetical protein
MALQGATMSNGWRKGFGDWWNKNRVEAHKVKNMGGFAAKIWKAALDHERAVAGATESTSGFYPEDGCSIPPRQAITALRAALAQQAEPVQRKPATGAAPCAMDFGVPPLFAARAENYARWALAQRAEPVLNGMEQAFSSEAMSRRDERQGLPASQQRADPVQEPVESALQAVAEKISDKCSAWYGIGARDVEEVLREAARYGLVPGALAQAEPVQRKPLTDKEMRHLWSLYGYKSALCMRFARAIEAAHGIKEAK